MQLSYTTPCRGREERCAAAAKAGAHLDDLQHEHEAAGELDRMWFRRHRQRWFRVRPITAAERVTLSAPGAGFVLVERIGLGFRVRWPVAIVGTLAGTGEALERFTGEGGA